MELIISVYIIFSLIAFVGWLLRGVFPALTILSSGFIIVIALPFYLLHTMIFHFNKQNRWGIIFFICCIALSLYLLLAFNH